MVRADKTRASRTRGRVKTTAKYQGSTVTYTARALKDGTTAYYRGTRRLHDGRSVAAAARHLSKAIAKAADQPRSRQVKVRGRKVTYARRVLKSGTVAYYRSGQRLTTKSQIATARRHLTTRPERAVKRRVKRSSPSTPAQQAARRFNRELGRRAPRTKSALVATGIPHIDKWGAPVHTANASQRYDFYVLVNVVAVRGKPGSHLDLLFDDPDADVDMTKTAPATLAIRGPQNRGLTRAEFMRDFDGHVNSELQRHGLELAVDQDLNDSLVTVWRRDEPL